MAAKTVGKCIAKTLQDAAEPLKAKDVITRVQSEMDVSEETIRSELSRMNKAGAVTQPKYAYYELSNSQQSVIGDLIPPDAAVVIRHPESNKIWITAKLSFEVTVHNPVELVRGDVLGGLDAEGHGL